MKFNVNNETGRLEKVIVGIINNAKFRAINLKSQYLGEAIHTEEELKEIDYDNLRGQVENFVAILIENGVQVYRPTNLETIPQLYVRDIGFVINDKFVVSKMRYTERKREEKGLDALIYYNAKQGAVVTVPSSATIEGGDIILHDNYIFVGVGNRTNQEGYKFLREEFPNKEVIPLYLEISKNPKLSVLHLDCVFQPVGEDSAIIAGSGIRNVTTLYDIFSTTKIIHITPEQRIQAFPNNMFPNILSLDRDIVISDISYTKLNRALEKRGVKVIGIDYSESAKNDGLFRCSTLPLYRHD